MNSFFTTPEQLAALDREARSWVGTPFVPHAMVKNAGVDCVHLVAGIYLACGALRRADVATFPGYTLDEGAHRTESRILDWFEARKDFTAVATTDLVAGDAIAFRLASVEHHLGLMLGKGDFIHALPGRVATISNLRESFYQRRITACFRPVTWGLGSGLLDLGNSAPIRQTLDPIPSASPEVLP